MKNIALNSTEDAIYLYETFGVKGVEFALKNQTLDMKSESFIRDVLRLASSKTLEIDSFNDGNNHWDIFAELHFKEDGSIDVNKTVIVRTGFGANRMNLTEAVGVIITKEQIQSIFPMMKLIARVKEAVSNE